jgi:hypothetical protein
MKKALLLLACTTALAATAQNNIPILHSEYMEMKKNKTLDVTKNYIFTDAVAPSGPPVKWKDLGNRTPSPICSCMIPLDTTFAYVPFVSYWSSPTTAVYGASGMNDDASSIPLNLPFSFNFYGVNYNQVYINNNGNISFNTYYSQFTANPFPDPSYNMIAPFWADIDTRDFSFNSAAVYYKITPTAMIVKWENVGYYDLHFDLHNTFQLIITDGTDPLLPAGTNVGYCYGDMQWTTGDVTGTGGFGSPATVGVNQGNGVDYFQVGTFNMPNPFFDGPYNSTDGVYWLNNQGMYFDVATIGNLPPVIINNNICDTIDVYTGDTLHSMLSYDTVRFNIGMSTPEISQTVTASFSCTADTSNFHTTLLFNTPTYKEYQCEFIARDLPNGLYYVTVTATDDGSPAKTTTHTVVIRSIWDPGITTAIQEANNLPEMSMFPNPADNNITIRHNFSMATKPTLTLVNVIGQTVMTSQLTANEQNIDMSSLAEGLYSATITTSDGKSKTIRIVKK